jgi:hypothetical protein
LETNESEQSYHEIMWNFENYVRLGQAWWLMSVIPAAGEVEIRRIWFQGQLWHKVSKASELKQPGVVWELVALVCCNPSYSGGRDQEDHDSKPAPANSL